MVQSALPTYAAREWPLPLLAPSLPCCLACWGCGCIPLYEIVRETAPFSVLGCVVPRGICSALLIALVLWFGTMHAVGHTAGIVLLLGWIFLSMAIKNHLGINESDIITGVKAFLCPPCHVGQIHVAVREFGTGSAYGLVQQPPMAGKSGPYSSAPPAMYQMP